MIYVCMNWTTKAGKEILYGPRIDYCSLVGKT